MKNSILRRIIAALIICILSFSLAGCASNNGKSSGSSSYSSDSDDSTTLLPSDVQAVLASSYAAQSKEGNAYIYTVVGQVTREDEKKDYYIVKQSVVNPDSNDDEDEDEDDEDNGIDSHGLKFVAYLFVAVDGSVGYTGTYNNESGQCVYKKSFDIKMN